MTAVMMLGFMANNSAIVPARTEPSAFDAYLLNLPRGPFLVHEQFPNLSYLFTAAKNPFEEMKRKMHQWDLCVIVGSYLYRPNSIPPIYSGYNFMVYPTVNTGRSLRIANAVKNGQRVVLVAHPLANFALSTNHRLRMLLKCFLFSDYHREYYDLLSFRWNRYYKRFKRSHSYQARNLIIS